MPSSRHTLPRIALVTLTRASPVDSIRVMASDEVKTRRFSRAEYDRLIELGVFQSGEPIELIGGELMVAEPQGAPHYTAIQKTAKALERAFGPGWTVRTQGPIGLDDDSEPEPDIAVGPGDPYDYGRAHPCRPVLTVEGRRGEPRHRSRLALRSRRGARRVLSGDAARRAGIDHHRLAAPALTS